MALLVNYEGVYQEPQKLWYLVDSVWKEVTNVFESPIQQELAVIDEQRISQDKIVLSLTTKLNLLNAQLSGDDPTVDQEVDQSKIDLINQEKDIISLQLEISQIEQVQITKNLFEQKAQVEYKKLVLQGEQAIEKIAKVVDSVSNWGVIRLDPQGPIDERLEVAIQHKLVNNDRIFNYGAVYYRLYKLDQIKEEDNLLYLADNFKRRLAKMDYENNTTNINYIMTTSDIGSTFNEVSQFVSAGAQRIIDFLASLRDQQKYILDNMETVKDNLEALELLSESSPLLSKDENGLILTNTTLTKTSLGKILFDTQNVSTPKELISQKTLDDIKDGTDSAENYLGYDKYIKDTKSLTEKIEAVSTLKNSNDTIIKDIQEGRLNFNTVNVLTSRKNVTTISKNLFWQSPLGNSTVATTGKESPYKQGYTSSGTYKFKNNELVILSTAHIAIINAILSNTKTIGLAITLGTEPYRIIQVIDANTVKVELLIETTTSAPAIVNVMANNLFSTESNVSVNDKIQPHHAIPFVKYTNTKNPGEFIDLSVYHPVINTVFYPNTFKVLMAETTNVFTTVYDRSFMIYEVPVLSKSVSINFNTFNTTDEKIKTNFAISNIETANAQINFNTVHVPSGEFAYNDNIISNIKSEKTHEINWNIKVTPVSEKLGTLMDNIISFVSVNQMGINFNTYQMRNNEYIAKNGYAQIVSNETIGTTGLMEIIKVDDEQLESILPLVTDLSYKDFYQQTRVVITSQTGVAPFIDFEDCINVSLSPLPKILTAINIQVSNIDYTMDKINRSTPLIPRISTMQSNVKIHTPIDTINKVSIQNIRISTLSGVLPTMDTIDRINKDASQLPVIAKQLNPGVRIS